ncbi:hypothetical protein [Rhizobium sp. MHM7A]|uniref:hypothetical protein n=1 Tax=Rhizobium sp. MHM7A TaxID=2583233 RepID=UPI00110592F5|nr:hypothetical protein [Rhizobium sp. MHM7A]TLX16898.1 hypothetical protein FFR93_06005 [Rhizobium sp. MHM7A]
MKMTMRSLFLATAVAAVCQFGMVQSSQAASSTLSSIMFQDSTGLNYSNEDIQSTWSALKSMGTDSFLGGMIGSFKLDEASLIAGALSIGATEFDNFLRTGSLGSVTSDISNLLSNNMLKAAGIDLSSLTGSFTVGGGSANGVFSATSVSAAASGGQCDPSVSNDLVNIGKKHVEMMREVALGDDYGISKINSLAGSQGTGTGFASLGCLDKLFQNAGSDILFKPPSLGNLMSQLQNWTCPKIPGVADQVMGGFGQLDMFNTQGMGGFYGYKAFGEANDGPVTPQPGLGNDVKKVFGSSFGTLASVDGSKISSITDLKKLFQ